MNLFDRLKQGLHRTREALVDRVDEALRRGRLDQDTLDELEEQLLRADVGVRTTDELIALLTEQAKRSGPGDAEAVRRALRDAVLDILRKGAASEPRGDQGHQPPHVVLVMGVNGVGKTTSIGKLAHRYVADGRSVLVAASDTFRAAAADQLSTWADRAGVQIVQHRPGSDPASVAFDALAAARARGVDVLIVDTAGRLHTKVNLMEELKKVRRVLAREMEGAPHETLLVLDATMGQNALAQARAFAEQVGVTGLILTKIDGTAKGGIVIAIARELGLVVRYLGIGESIDDLVEFDPVAFADALFGVSATDAPASAADR